MVGIVIISHSEKVAEGIKDLAIQMAQDAPIATAGGTSDGRLGTDVNKIVDAINEVYSEDGVLLLFDLGSAYMNAEMAIESLDESKKDNVQLVDTALVEGAVSAAVESSIGKSIEEIQESLKTMCLNKMP
jgi:phosphoenolpyruvate---glycerone phosphotransferase subunit DhaM